ncbi:hypothetical protein JOF56_006643 [Kibdelosporangium banguiense]|uniref:Tachylectin n=1 Tax=Kibdelosporangium banguiense TaxID=1365924 RepID=A0ABS4TQS6_9PSEU|nr:tachylectin-related carbohydrate-binding protein [Kibdelosporangium banguiense]MBP2326258.1 hypothetical protein [Kibdelosporangium banguiense]
MREKARPSLRRMAWSALAAVLAATGIQVMATVNVASAVQTTQCTTPVNIFVGMSADPGLTLRKHKEPIQGYNDWAPEQGVGWGWDNRFFTGPSGYVYFIDTDGSLNRHQWTPTGWANNGVSVRAGTGFAEWNSAASRYRITVDTNNHFYYVSPNGELTWGAYDEATKVWTKRVIATGWNKYNQVFAAGDGVIWTRDASIDNGALLRSQYDYRTQTWTQQPTKVGAGWNGFKQIASPGGDVIYGMNPGGELWAYRWLPAENQWALNSLMHTGEKVSNWTGTDEFAPAVDSCRLTGNFAADVQCSPEANVWGHFSNNAFRLKPHTEPETGYSAFNTDRHIGNGWNMRFMAGNNGYKYLILPEGKLNRHQWTSTGWANGGISTEIGSGDAWKGWDNAAYHFRITVDTNNDFYAVPASGNLERRVYDDLAKTWQTEVLDSGWGKYDQVFAAGNGVLYARDRNVGDGTLYRYHYDSKNRRWLDYGTEAGVGWNFYKQMVSPGADIIYGLEFGYGVQWYRFDPAAKQYVANAEGVTRKYLMWWENAQEITADIDACKLTNPVTVTPPATTAPHNEKAQMIYNSAAQRLEVGFVGDNGILYRGYQGSAGSESIEFQALSGFQNFTGRAALASRQDGKLVALGRGTDSQSRTYTQATAGGTTWTGPTDLKGAMASSPILVRGSNNLLTAFAVDSAGQLWFAEQFDAAGAFKPWRKATNTGTYTMSEDFSVVPNGSSFDIVYRSASNAVAVKKFTNGALAPARVASGLTVGGIPAGVTFADGLVQVVARGADNKLYTQKETASGFAGWTDISGTQTFAGSPSALLNVHGIVEVAARGSDGNMYRGGQTVPGATTWRNWHTNFDTAATDPMLAAAGGTEQRVFFRDNNGNYYLWQVPAYSSTTLRSAQASKQDEPIKVIKGNDPSR